MLGRALWGIVWFFLFRPTPRPFHLWRVFLLRMFGARIPWKAKVYNTAVIWAPWNLEMGEHSAMGPYVNCYNVALIRIGAHATVSQHSYLCAATHDISDPQFAIVAHPIVIEDQAWVAADAFVGPGVTVGAGGVVGARACVYSDVPPWHVVLGNPAQIVQKRTVRDANISAS